MKRTASRFKIHCRVTGINWLTLAELAFLIFMKCIILLAAIITIALLSFRPTEKERYFFVGYAYEGGQCGGLWITAKDGKFINQSDAIRDVRRTYGYTKKISITGLYEFRNKEDFEQSQK